MSVISRIKRAFSRKSAPVYTGWLTKDQAEFVKRLLCDESRKPEDVAKRFYRRYPRRQFERLWSTDEKGVKTLTVPDPFTEGCELGDQAMRVLGDVWEEDGKEYIKADSPFLAVMRRAVMG